MLRLQWLKVLLLALLVLTACSSKPKELDTAELNLDKETSRALNKDNYTVTDTKGTCYTSDGKLYVKNSEIKTEINPVRGTTLSKVGSWIYYLGEEGLVRYDTVTYKTERVYFDDIDQVAVGLKTIYYVVKKGMYSFDGESYKTHPLTWDGTHFYLRNNYLLYGTDNGAVKVDLVTDEEIHYKGVLKDIVTTDFGFILELDGESVSIR